MSFVGAAGRRLAAGLLVLLTAASVLVGAGAGPAQADILTDQKFKGSMPIDEVLNTRTNKIYVTNYTAKSVMVIDGNTMTAKSIAVTEFPAEIAINEITNKIYVSHAGSKVLTVIDGASEMTTTIALTSRASVLAINSKTNKIYVSHRGVGLSVIDGSTRTATLLPSPLAVESMAVDETTNRVFVSDWVSKKTAVLDGANHTFSTIDLGCVAQSLVLNGASQQVFFACPAAKAFAALNGQTNGVTLVPTGTDASPSVMAINRKANMVYASDKGGRFLTALDGATLKVTNTPVGDTNYQSMAVNETTNKVYASDHYNYRVMVFDSQANLLGDVRDFNNPADLVANEVTNKIYVLDSGAAEIRIIDGKNVAPVFTSGTVPNTGTVGDLYEHHFTASGSLVPQFRVASGTLPPGLALEAGRAGGRLAGVPTIPGTYSFRVAATNGYNPDSVSPVLTITIKAAKVGHDFNGDRKPDVLSRDGNGNLWLYPGQGNGGWLPRIQVGQGWNVMTSIVAPGDFNGDGTADVLARDANGALWLYPGNGGGGWFGRIHVGQGWNSMSAVTAVGDLDLDGNADLVARSQDGYLWLYRGNGKGGWLPQTSLWNGWQVLTAVVGSGDFTKDGVPDLLAADGAGALQEYSGHRTRYDWGVHSYFTGPTTVGYGWNAMTAIVGPGDFNGDGNVDLLARDAGGALWLYPSNGQGGWLPRGLVGSGWNAMNLII